MITLVCASANPDKVAEIQQLLAGVVELLPRPAEHPRRRGGCRHARRQRPAEGGGDHGGDRSAGGGRRHRASRSMRSAGRRACTPHGTRARAAATPTIGRKMLRELDGVDRSAERRSRPWRWSCGPTAPNSPSRVCVRERSPSRSVARSGSATTRSSSRTRATARTFAEMGAEAKNELSHRGRAFRGLLSELARR